MNKKIAWIISEAVIVILLLFVVIYQAQQIEFLKLAYGAYTVGNFKNYRRLMLVKDMPVYNKVAEKYGISAYTLASIGIKENLNSLYSHGVKKIDVKSLKSNPRQWQAEACAKIAREELLRYVYEDDTRLKEYYAQLGNRYCGWDKNYGRDIFLIHKQLQEVKK